MTTGKWSLATLATLVRTLRPAPTMPQGNAVPARHGPPREHEIAVGSGAHELTNATG